LISKILSATPALILRSTRALPACVSKDGRSRGRFIVAVLRDAFASLRLLRTRAANSVASPRVFP
jgi:hypothetical protein